MSEIWNLSTLCRCCHSDGRFKKLNLPYQSENAIETYEIMLLETLGIKIIQPTVDQASYTICDSCIKRLQEASRFREQVLACEQKFKIYLTNEQFLHSAVQLEDVKTEVKSNEIGDYDVKEDDDVQRDDDDCLQPDDCDTTTVPVKEEIKIEVDLGSSIITKEEKASVRESIKKKRKATVKKGGQRAKPVRRDRRFDLPSFDRGRKLFEAYVVKKQNKNGVTYSCKNCEGTYDNIRTIFKHIHTQHRDRCKCEQCGKSFKFFTHLNKHVKSQHGKAFACRHCEKKFDNKYNLSGHEKTHMNTDSYECDVCQKVFKYKRTLRRHIITHDTKVLCDICGSSFTQRCSLIAHIQTVHLKLRPYPCTMCSKKYTTRKILNTHIQIAHFNNTNVRKRYQCDVCKRIFSVSKNYKLHRLAHDNRFACRYCSKVFDVKKDLEIHWKTHSKKNILNNSYSCNVCGKVLTSRIILKRHLDGHRGIKYPCNVCGKKFTQKRAAELHHLYEHDPSGKFEKVKCDLCDKKFTTNNALHRHKQRMHSGVSYVCDICGKKYLRKGSYQRHVLNKHKVKK